MSNCPGCQDWPRAANFSPQVPKLGADTEAVLQCLATDVSNQLTPSEWIEFECAVTFAAES